MENLFNNCSALWSDYSTKVAMSVADSYEGTGQSFSLSEETEHDLKRSLSSYGFSDNEIRDILDDHGVNENTAYKLIGFCLDKIDRKEEDSLYLLKEALKDEYEELSEEEVWNINKCRQEHRELLNKTLNKGVVIDCSENITLNNYMGYETINETVHGTICHAGTIENVQLTPFDKPINIDIWANDEFMIDDREEFEKLNAVGTILTGQPIYGDIYLLVSEEVNDELDNRGFSYKETKEGEEDLCECWLVEDELMRFINNNRDEINKLHKKWDYNKPYRVVTSFEIGEVMKAYDFSNWESDAIRFASLSTKDGKTDFSIDIYPPEEDKRKALRHFIDSETKSPNAYQFSLEIKDVSSYTDYIFAGNISMIVRNMDTGMIYPCTLSREEQRTLQRAFSSICFSCIAEAKNAGYRFENGTTYSECGIQRDDDIQPKEDEYEREQEMEEEER